MSVGWVSITAQLLRGSNPFISYIFSKLFVQTGGSLGIMLEMQQHSQLLALGVLRDEHDLDTVDHRVGTSSHSRLHGSSSYRVPWAFDEEASAVLRRFVRLGIGDVVALD